MQLPNPLPTDPDELERLYQTYQADVEDFDEDEFKRLMDARLAVWGIDPHQMSPQELFGAMTESVNSMLMNLYAAKDSAPDDEAAGQVDEIIRLAEQLRLHVTDAQRDVLSDDFGAGE